MTERLRALKNKSLNFKTIKSGGFTKIELIVVIVVISIVIRFVFVTFDPLIQLQKSRDSKRKSDLSKIQSGLELYHQRNGRYPENSEPSDYRIKKHDGFPADWGSSWSPYMSSLPKDSGSKTYIYVLGGDGQSYWLYASLERGGNDQEACKATDSQCKKDPKGPSCRCENAPVDKTCGNESDICNYGISSGNVTP